MVGGDKAGADGVEVDVVAAGAEIVAAALVDDKGFVAPAEEVAEKLMAAIEAAGVGGQEPLHARGQIGLRGLGDEMKMVSHQAPGVELPGRLLTGFAEGAQKSAAVEVIEEDGFAAVAAAHEVVGGPWRLNSERLWHKRLPQGAIKRSGTDGGSAVNAGVSNMRPDPFQEFREVV